MKAKLPAIKRKTIGLKTSLAGVILLTVSITAAVIHIPWSLTSRKNITNIVNQLNQEIVRGVNDEVEKLFSDTISTQNTIQEMLETNIIDIDDKKERTAFYLTFLKANPHISWISFGYPNGDFFGIQRERSGILNNIESLWDPETKQATRLIETYQQNKQYIKLLSTSLVTSDYYAPKRSWYKKAIANSGQIIWTDVYIFDTSKKPGINSAITLYKNGEFIGVISIAIELERISLYLKNIDISKTGTAFIINSENQLIASQDINEIQHDLNENNENLQIKLLKNSAKKELQIANKVLIKNKVPLDNLKTIQQFIYTDKTGEKYFVFFAPTNTLDWVIVTVIPESDFLEEINHNTQNLLYAVVFLIIIAAILAMFLAGKIIAEPLLKIIKQTKYIENFNLEEIRACHSIIKEIDQLSLAIDQMGVGLASFKRYLPTELVRTLIQEGMEAKLGGEEKILTIFFLDLVSFTKLFEQSGNEMIPHLAEFYYLMSKNINQCQGTIDKYIGDCIMAFWGAPIHNYFHAKDACRAALECQRTLSQCRPRWQQQGKWLFHARIGINSGNVLVGNIGSEEKMDYTAIGDPVNVASRLEALNKIYGTEILIGEETYKLAKDDIFVRFLDTVAVYGKEESLNIYELLAMKNEIETWQEWEWVQFFQEGMTLYQNRKWSKAIEFFAQAIELRGGLDLPSSLYIDRCVNFIANPPNADWKPITILHNK